MSKELPFFKFYPSEWLIGKISFQPLEIQGAFTQCVCMYWQNNCVLRSSDVDFRIGQDNLKKLIDLGFISEDENGLNIKFLKEQYSDFDGVRKVRAEAGAKGGKANAKQTEANAKQNEAEKRRDREDKEKEKKREEEIKAPALSDVLSYFKEKGFKVEIAEKAFNFYNDNNWIDGKGNKVRNWKMKMQSVWFKDENKCKPEYYPSGISSTFVP